MACRGSRVSWARGQRSERSERRGDHAEPGSSQLDGAQVQSTVSLHGRREAQLLAASARLARPQRSTSARVVVTITVAGSGSVQNVTTSGDPRGYPGLANCIAGRVRGWQFPPSSGTTTVNVPFVFAAQ